MGNAGRLPRTEVIAVPLDAPGSTKGLPEELVAPEEPEAPAAELSETAITAARTSPSIEPCWPFIGDYGPSMGGETRGNIGLRALRCKLPRH